MDFVCMRGPCEVATSNGILVSLFALVRRCSPVLPHLLCLRRDCMSQQPVLLNSSIPLVEEGLAHCNEASDRFDGDGPLEQFLKADNLQQADKTMTTTNLPILDSNPIAPSPMSGSPVPSVHDSASFHSLPTLQVTEPQEAPSIPHTPQVHSLSDEDSVPSAQRSIRSTPTTPLRSSRRTHPPRTPVEVRCFPYRVIHFHTLTLVLHRVDLPTDFRVFSRTSFTDVIIYPHRPVPQVIMSEHRTLQKGLLSLHEPLHSFQHPVLPLHLHLCHHHHCPN